MPRMWDFKTQQWVETPEGQVENFYRSGARAFPKGSRVNIQLPNGEFGLVDESKLPMVLSAGGAYDTTLAREKRLEAEEFGGLGGAAIATGIGVSRGLLTEPFGDWVVSKFTPLSADDIDKYAEQSPVAAGVGEIGGFLGAAATTILSGGGAAAARGAAQVGAKATAKELAAKAIAKTPAALATKSGLVAEKYIGSRLGVGAAESFAGKAAGVGAAGFIGGGADAAVYGTIDAIGEELLGDSQRTASAILSDIGTFALIGGGLGGVIGGSLAGGAKLVEGIRGIEKMAGAPISKKAGEAIDHLSAALGKGDFATLQKFRNDPKYAWKVLNADQHIDDAADASVEVFDDMVNTLQDVSSHVKGSKKKSHMTTEVEVGHEFDALNEVYTALLNVRSVVRDFGDSAGVNLGPLRKLDRGAQETLESVRKELESRLGVTLAVHPKKPELGWQVVKEVRRKVKGGKYRKVKTYKPLTKVISTPSQWGDFAPWLFNRLDDWKKSVGSHGFNLKPFDNSQAAMNTHSQVLRIYEGSKGILENEALWGRAAKLQRGVNKPFHNLLTRWPKFQQSFGGIVKKGVYRGDRNKFKRLIKDFVSEENGLPFAGDQTRKVQSIKDIILDETFVDYYRFIKAVQQNYGVKGGGATLKKMENLNQVYREMTGTMNGVRALKDLASKGSNGLVGLTGGAYIGGFGGVFTGLMTQSVLNPAQAVRVRAALQSIKNRARLRRDRAVNRAVRRLFTSPKSKKYVPMGSLQYDKSGRIREPWLRRLYIVGHAGSEDKDMRPVPAQAKRTIEAVSNLANNPEHMTTVMDKSLAPLNGAPNLREAVQQQSIGGAQYIMQNLPTGINQTTDMLTGKTKWLITDAGAHELMQMVATTNDWVGSVGSNFEAGTLTPAIVKAAKGADPEGFAEYQAAVHEGVISSGKTPPVAWLGQLSILLETPVSSAYAGSVLKIHQGFYRMPDKAQTQKARMNALKQRPKDMMTKTQEIGRV